VIKKIFSLLGNDSVEEKRGEKNEASGSLDEFGGGRKPERDFLTREKEKRERRRGRETPGMLITLNDFSALTRRGSN